MTKKEAYEILGLAPGTEMTELKKRYRQLMTQVHPDVDASLQESYGYSAQEINAAYAVLGKKKGASKAESPDGGGRTKKSAAKRKKRAVWDAPVNENAYREREVLQYAEEIDGTVLGEFCVARGKYMWKAEEDFPLFLRSIYKCSKELLDEADAALCREAPAAMRMQMQAQLSYLLAQQFTDAEAMLKEFAKEEKADGQGRRTFYIPAMLELADKTPAPKAGEKLYPARIFRHRLYVKSQTQRETGYLSFLDDRFYYVVIPLFEQKRVQVRMETAQKQVQKRRKAAGRYQNLHLWIRLCDADGGMPENLNLQIGRLLEKYRENSDPGK